MVAALSVRSAEGEAEGVRPLAVYKIPLCRAASTVTGEGEERLR